MVNESYKDGTLVFDLEKSIYSEDILYKCFYWYGNDFTVNIVDKVDKFEVSIKFNDQKEIDFQKLTQRIKQDLIDFKLRDIVTKETKNIRELIVAKAFAYYQIEENPTTEISDPVGFNPNQF